MKVSGGGTHPPLPPTPQTEVLGVADVGQHADHVEGVEGAVLSWSMPGTSGDGTGLLGAGRPSSERDLVAKQHWRREWLQLQPRNLPALHVQGFAQVAMEMTVVCL